MIKDSAKFGFGLLAAGLVSAFATFLIPRYYDSTVYAQYSLFVAIVSSATAFLFSGMRASLIRDIASATDPKSRIIANIILIAIVGSGTALLYPILLNFSSFPAHRIYGFVPVAISCCALFDLAQAVSKARLHGTKFSVVQISRAVLFLTLTLLLTNFSSGLLLAFAGSYLVVGLFDIRQQLKFPPGNVLQTLLAAATLEIYEFRRWLPVSLSAGSNLFFLLFLKTAFSIAPISHSEKGKLLIFVDLAQWSIGLAFAAIGTVFFSTLSKAQHSSWDISIRRMRQLCVFLVAPSIGFGVFGYELFSKYFYPEISISDGKLICLLLVASFVINAIRSAYYDPLLQVLERRHYQFYASTLLIFIVGLSTVLFRNSPVGIASSILAASMCACLLMTYAAAKNSVTVEYSLRTSVVPIFLVLATLYLMFGPLGLSESSLVVWALFGVAYAVAATLFLSFRSNVFTRTNGEH